VIPTPSQTAGPFLHIGLSGHFGNQLVDRGAAGVVQVFGAVLDGAGEPVTDAVVEIWQAGPDGGYRPGGFGRSGTVDGGRFSFVTVKPGALAQAPHLELCVFARGLLKPVVTRMYLPDEVEANAADPVLSAVDPERRSTLVAVAGPDGLRFDIRLQGDDETVFFAR
jgi:protocatechuate 3,4-dioxygenase alpha subunit